MSSIARIARTLIMCAMLWSTAGAATPEYQLEAVFLFNFTQFVEWPADAFADNNSPLVIGVLGEDPFSTYLDDIVRGESVNGRALVIEHYRNVSEIKSCHILYVSRSEAATLPKTLTSLKGRSILTASDLDGFALNGGVVRFVLVDNKLRLRVSLDSAQAARLTISSKLLRRVELVNRGED